MAYLGFDPQVSSTSYRNIDDISASFDGFITTFPLRVGGVVPGIAPINEQQLLINVGGVPQQPDPSGVNGFKLSAGNIVFSSAPSIGEKFWGVILAGVDRASAGVSYPDGSVTAPSITFDAQTTTGLYRSGSNQLAIALNGLNPVTFTTTGLRLNGATSGTVTLAAPAVAGGNTLTLPANNGTNGQALTTNGSGGLTWSTVTIPGEVKYFAMTTAPSGFLKANGAELLIAAYTALYTALTNSGTVFPFGANTNGSGSAGSTHFRLPDLRGEFVRGWDDSRGIDSARTFGSTQSGQIQSHSHPTGGTESNYKHVVAAFTDGSFDGTSYTASTNDANYNANSRTDTTGGTETRPRNIALLACIAF
jgi:microcystin-dependent protein